MHIQYYPIVILEDERLVDDAELDSQTAEVISIFRDKFLKEGLFFDIEIVSPKDEMFKTIAKEIKSAYQTRLLRLLEIAILEPWVDYFDAQFEEYYDNTLMKPRLMVERYS